MKHIKIFIAMLAFGLMSTPAIAQSWTQRGQDIIGAADYDYSGMSVSLSSNGNVMAIGSPYNDARGNSNAGLVRVYERINGSWVRKGTDIIAGQAGDECGRSVSLSNDGNTVAVGVPYGSSGRGYVAVFKFMNGVWTQQGWNVNGEAVGDWNGWEVSLSADGSSVAIGAPLGGSAGYVRVFKFINGTWVKQGANIVGEAGGDLSGYSVALSSDGATVAVGSPHNDGNGVISGSARVYKLVRGAWIKQGSDIDGEAGGDKSGSSVSLSADGMTLAVGSPLNGSGDRGLVQIYRNSGGAWVRLGAKIYGEAAGDESGTKVSLSANGGTVAIGAPRNGNNDAGHARVYKLANGVWTQQGSDIDGNAADDLSGLCLSLSADGLTVAIGAPYWGSLNRGQTRVFSWQTAPKHLSEDVAVSSATLETTGSNLEAKIYPNPVRETATLQYTLEEPTAVEVNVYDLFGRLGGTPLTTNEQSAGEYAITLPVGELSAGLYNVVMTTPKGRVSQKLVVVK